MAQTEAFNEGEQYNGRNLNAALLHTDPNFAQILPIGGSVSDGRALYQRLLALQLLQDAGHPPYLKGGSYRVNPPCALCCMF